MSHAEICPICGGGGKIIDGDQSALLEKVCHGCGGSGWIAIQDDIKPVTPIIHFVDLQPILPFWYPNICYSGGSYAV